MLGFERKTLSKALYPGDWTWTSYRRANHCTKHPKVRHPRERYTQHRRWTSEVEVSEVAVAVAIGNVAVVKNSMVSPSF